MPAATCRQGTRRQRCLAKGVVAEPSQVTRPQVCCTGNLWAGDRVTFGRGADQLRSRRLGGGSGVRG